MTVRSIDLPADYYDHEDGDQVCIHCGRPRFSTYRNPEHFGFPLHFQRCECGLIKQTPMPNERFFEWFFNSDVFYSSKETSEEYIWGFYDYFKDEPCRLATSKSRFRRLKKFFGAERNLKIMKIGPSTGTFLYVAKQHGHDARGVDVSAKFVDFAKSTYGVDIEQGRFERMGYADGSFDVVVLFNVIENIPNLDEVLRAIHKSIAPGGYFIFNHVEMSGNIIEKLQGDKYFLFRPPICWAFTSRALYKILNDRGFSYLWSCRDIRYMHLEKILTLLNMKTLLRAAQMIGIDRIPFRIYAYPSKITVMKRL